MAHVRSKLCPFFAALFVGIFSVPTFLHSQDFAPNELIVKFKNEAPELAVDSSISPRGISILTGQSRTRFVKKILPAFSSKNAAQNASTTATFSEALFRNAFPFDSDRFPRCSVDRQRAVAFCSRTLSSNTFNEITFIKLTRFQTIPLRRANGIYSG